MVSQYHPKEIELNARNLLDQAVIPKKEKPFYCLTMFPYPSGQLHMGHVRVYTICDAISRYKKIKGFDVFNPMGWDAFGLPAENAAIKHETDPASWTKQNIAQMKEQMKLLSLDFDWECELQTCAPDYYRWQQWLFLQMHKQGLVYRKKAMVNWDPVDQTVLANEQVIDGRGWRSGAKVEQKNIDQWFIRITKYADALLNDLDGLEWSHAVKVMQQNWIGRSKGVEVHFKLTEDENIPVFTTRVDTLFGVSAVMIAHDHPLAIELASTDPHIKNFISECKKAPVDEATLETTEKKGIPTSKQVYHPLSNEPINVWIANYVVSSYGTGAVMCVPAHDQRDYDFAVEHNLPIKQVIRSDTEESVTLPLLQKGTLMDSDSFSGMKSEDAITAITKKLVESKSGTSITQYRLRDWGVSRQRYWGCPIPMIHCPECGIVPEKEENLPVLLPKYNKDNNAMNDDAFTQTTCPNCQQSARRESDTFDTFVDSSWYYLRYPCFDSSEQFLDHRTKGLVDLYIGGVEHAILHLLYARFMHKVIRDLGFIQNDEPFKRLLNQGMVLKDGSKMSKSKGNIVSPVDIIDVYGADACRMFITFAAPPHQNLEWSDQGLEGNFRFLKRVWASAQADKEIINTKASAPSKAFIILKQINQDYEREQLNTVVSGTMKLFKLLNETTDASERAGIWKILLITLYPICPNISAVLWPELGFKGQINEQQWPEVDETCIQAKKIQIAVQINGKHRANIEVDPESDQESVVNKAKDNEKIQKMINGSPLKRIIYVPNKILSLIL